MRNPNRSTGYAYSLRRRRRSGPFVRLAVLLAIGGAAAAGLSLWQGKSGGPDGAAHQPAPAARAVPAKATATANVTTMPLLRPGYVAGYVARPMAESRPLAGAFQSARPAPDLAGIDPETTGSIAPSAASSPAVAAILPPAPPATEATPKIALTGPLPVPRPADLRLPSVPEPRPATRATSRRGKDVAAAAEPPVDNRSFIEKIFGVRAPSTGGTQLAYAAPQDDISGRGRGSGLTVAPAPVSPLASPASVGPKTAVYDISARTVYLPNGERLVAQSGLGDKMNDLRYVHVRMHGPTPPHVYTLTEREALFHGVRAIRMHPVGGAGKIFGRTGLLVHSYLLGPRGDSNGCVSIKDYDRFLQAFLRGEINRLVVVAGRS